MGVSHSFNGSLTGERPLARHWFDDKANAVAGRKPDRQES